MRKLEENTQQQIVMLKWGYDLRWALLRFVSAVEERFLCRPAIPGGAYFTFNLSTNLGSAIS